MGDEAHVVLGLHRQARTLSGKDVRSKQEEPHALQGVHGLQLGIPAELWRPDSSFEEDGIDGGYAYESSSTGIPR